MPGQPDELTRPVAVAQRKSSAQVFEAPSVAPQRGGTLAVTCAMRGCVVGLVVAAQSGDGLHVCTPPAAGEQRTALGV